MPNVRQEDGGSIKQWGLHELLGRTPRSSFAVDGRVRSGSQAQLKFRPNLPIMTNTGSLVTLGGLLEALPFPPAPKADDQEREFVHAMLVECFYFSHAHATNKQGSLVSIRHRSGRTWRRYYPEKSRELLMSFTRIEHYMKNPYVVGVEVEEFYGHKRIRWGYDRDVHDFIILDFVGESKG